MPVTELNGHQVHVSAFPIGIDAEERRIYEPTGTGARRPERSLHLIERSNHV